MAKSRPEVVMAGVKEVCTEIEQAAEKLAMLRARLDKATDHIKVLPVEHACVAFLMIRDAQEALHGVSKEFTKYEGELRYGVVPKIFELSKTKSWTSDNKVRFTVVDTLSAGIIPDKKEKAFTWLRKHEHGDLIKETVNAQSLSATARYLMEQENKELPESMFTIKTGQYVSITGRGKGGDDA